MKRIILALAATLLSLTAMAQEQVSRTMRVFYGGKVVYTRGVGRIDSINFLADTSGGGVTEPDTPDPVGDTNSVYIGVVAFNEDLYQLPITDDLEKAKTFINQRTNYKDATAFAYAVSKGNLLFDAAGLPEFDKIYMLNFSDGTDNYSSSAWYDEGRRVFQNSVYDTARHDLLQRTGLNSYAMGFGEQSANFREKMQKVVMGGGRYHSAVSSVDLQPTFNQIANAIIASAQNITLQTKGGLFVEGAYKYFRFIFTAGELSDTVWAKMEGENATGYMLFIAKPGLYARFDDMVHSDFDEQTKKVILPLNNLKFVVGGEDVPFEFRVELSYDGEFYYADKEDASMSEAISKRIAVVLVLDCSSSMGDAFQPMKDAAIDLIETLEKMAAEQSGGTTTPITGDSYTEDLGNGVKMVMKKVKGGTFTMGCTSEQGSDCNSNESPSHSVTLSDYYIGQFEVTQAQWKAVMGTNPSNFKNGDDYPVESVSWTEAVQFCAKLSELTGRNYHLPTEAEWEYAARGGQNADGTKYAGSNTVGDVAWYDGNSGLATHRVGQKQPNGLGLYDMSGNVYEWCSDWYGSYSSTSATNPQGPSSGSSRVERGGGRGSDAVNCRVSRRYYCDPVARYNNLGLRVACSSK